jgi:hypothetical protein
VAKQRDAYASGLYWHTDLEAAKVVAKATGKRILSLRLLGNLNEDFSCANSRFFRTALYANKEVSAYLRQNYVLHWKSVRPVPKLTIDMGDGRKIERTITGNSIHYVLNADGVVLDAVPGLYGPSTFVNTLRKSDDLAKFAVSESSGREWLGYSEYHRNAAEAIQRTWLAEAVRAGAYGEGAARGVSRRNGAAIMERLTEFASPTLTSLAAESPVTNAFNGGPLTAVKIVPAPEAARLAVGKGLVERPILHRAMPGELMFNGRVEPLKTVTISVAKPTAAVAAPVAKGKSRVEAPILLRAMPDGEMLKEAKLEALPGETLPERMTPTLWKKLAEFRIEETKLDEASRRLMIAKLPVGSVRAEERASGNVANESTAFAKTLRNFEGAMAEDTVRNEYLFHGKIHQWLGDSTHGRKLASNVEVLNAKVYSELFLTPGDDAWLGLVPEHVYSALDKDGGVCEVAGGKGE